MADADTKPIWVDEEFIGAENVATAGGLPIWSPPGGADANLTKVDGSRAAAAGLRNRPTRETARDCISWWKSLPEDRTEKLRAGLSADREAELLELWNERNT